MSPDHDASGAELTTIGQRPRLLSPFLCAREEDSPAALRNERRLAIRDLDRHVRSKRPRLGHAGVRPAERGVDEVEAEAIAARSAHAELRDREPTRAVHHVGE